MEVLDPYLIKNGGVLTSEHLVYDEAQERGNLIIGYIPPGWTQGDKTVSMIGSHLDVVPGNPEEWTEGRDPFTLAIEASSSIIKKNFINYYLQNNL